jgi:hypothetical protein
MPKITPEQIDRGLNLAEAVVGLATDVWNHRKLARKRAPRLAQARPTAKAKPRTKPKARSAGDAPGV